MKKIVLGILVAGFAVGVQAGGVAVPDVNADTTYRPCDGGAAGGKAPIWGGSGQVVAATDAVFTRNGFDIQCSANVHLGFEEASGTLAYVAAGSAKGNQYFSGHTNGGAISANGKCTGTNDACGTTDVDSGITAAKAAAASS